LAGAADPGTIIPMFLFTAIVALLLAANPAPVEVSSNVPVRIVAIAPSTAEIVCLLGACDRIVGVSRFCVHPPELKTRTPVGGLYDPDLEAIIALKPDLLITRGKQDALERLAESLSVPIYRDESDSIAGIELTIQDLGRRLSRTAEANVLVAEFRASLEAIRRKHAGGPRVRALLTVSRHPDRLANILTVGRETFLGEMLEIAGAQNVFGDLDMRYPEVSLESILVRRPEVIIELMPEADLSTGPDRLTDPWNPHRLIPAVRDGRVHVLADENALIPSPRCVQIVEKFARLLHNAGSPP
jgi:iron complex transport system substrate-binding protein